MLKLFNLAFLFLFVHPFIYQSNPQIISNRILNTQINSSSVIINQNRLPYIHTFCKTIKSQILTTDDYNTNKYYFDTLHKYFPAQPTTYINTFITLDFQKIYSQIKNMPGIIVFILPFFIGLVLSILLWPFLLCCCLIPQSCPIKKCQKQQNYVYTEFELNWPIVTLVILLVLNVVISIPGIIKALRIQNDIQRSECSLSIFMDDLLNGNLTLQKTTFFSGISTFNSYFPALNNNINNIINNFTNNLSPNLQNIIIQTDKTNQAIQLLSDGVTVNSTLKLSYNNPTPSSSIVNSNFPPLLGNPTNTSTLTGALYIALESINNIMTTTNNLINHLKDGTSQIIQMVSFAGSNVNNFYVTVSQTNTTLKDTMDKVKFYGIYFKISMLAFYGSIVGVSIMILVGTLAMSCFQRSNCRYIIYSFCVLICFITLLGFIICFILSILIPISYFVCSTANDGLSTPDNFKNLIIKLNIDPSIGNYLSPCLKGGTGQILTGLGSQNLTIIIKQILDTMKIADNYSIYDSKPLLLLSSSLKNITDNYFSTNIIDIIDDKSSANYLIDLANKKYYNSCNIASIIPSQGNKIIGCAGNTNITSSCKLFANCLDSCISLQNIFSNYKSSNFSNTQIRGDISSYAPNCNLFQLDIMNLYNNWWLQKYIKLNDIDGVLFRVNYIDKNLSKVIADLPKLTGNFSQVYNLMLKNIGQIVDPIKGLLAGTNCLLIGQNLLLAKDSFCVILFNDLYFIFVSFGVLSFAGLFIQCCAIFNGVRFYKQNNQLKIKSQQKVEVEVFDILQTHKNFNPDL